MIFLQKQKYKYVDVWFDCGDFLCNVGLYKILFNVGLYKIWLIVVNDLVENILFIFSYIVYFILDILKFRRLCKLF